VKRVKRISNLLRENLRDNFLTIDGQTLADGRYIFKITARDSLSNPSAQISRFPAKERASRLILTTPRRLFLRSARRK
jgi:hypothetical protein